ncbi:MAG TPA: signal peptidase II [Candidatus Saccharimonadales bacterium]|nr:signal peptidase II [Candidatus Saccharimonadales bacterium]
MTGPLLSGRRITWAAAIAVLALDQVSKAALVRALDPDAAVSLVPGLFRLTLVTNTGGVFGILRDLNGPGRSILFGMLPLAAILLLVWYARSINPPRALPLGAIGLILGGAAGNLLDRIRLGHVVDFLDAYVGDWHWPAFNLADSGICVGVALLLLDSLISRPAGEDAPPAAPAPPS